MKVVLLAAMTFALASPAFATGSCSTAPQSSWQPQSALEEQLKSEGLTIKQIKVESGCYEVYATDNSGKRLNLAYNAETLERLDNPEAGEN
jgi:hypothetical protein